MNERRIFWTRGDSESHRESQRGESERVWVQCEHGLNGNWHRLQNRLHFSAYYGNHFHSLDSHLSSFVCFRVCCIVANSANTAILPMVSYRLKRNFVDRHSFPFRCNLLSFASSSFPPSSSPSSLSYVAWNDNFQRWGASASVNDANYQFTRIEPSLWSSNDWKYSTLLFIAR